MNNIEVFKEILKNIELYYNVYKIEKAIHVLSYNGKYSIYRVRGMFYTHRIGVGIYDHSIINAGLNFNRSIECSFLDTRDIKCEYNLIGNVNPAQIDLSPNSNTWGVQQQNEYSNYQGLEIPCTEEEYFMYSLKYRDVLSYEDYIEFEELRKRIYDSGIYENIRITIFRNFDLEKIEEINEYLKSTLNTWSALSALSALSTLKTGYYNEQ